MRSPLIIGGGPAGTAAAIAIASAGHAVTLLERNLNPTDKICGDFLSGTALAALHRLGLDAAALGGAPIHTIRLVHRYSAAEAALPFPALGLARRVLDEALLQHAARRGATVIRGQMVQSLRHTAEGCAVRTTTGTITAGSVFLATGKHDVRGLPRPARGGDLLGLKMYYDLAPDQRAALDGRIELLLLRGGYAGLQLVAPDRAVLCLLLPAQRYRDAGKNWAALLDSLGEDAPLLRQRLAGAVSCLPQPLAIAHPPYGHLHRTTAHTPPALFRLGDQACVVPSLAGDGIAIALSSGVAAAGVWLHGGDAVAYHTCFARQTRTPLRLASAIHAACCFPAAQAMITAACRAWPAALRLAASRTRVAPAA